MARIKYHEKLVYNDEALYVEYKFINNIYLKLLNDGKVIKINAPIATSHSEILDFVAREWGWIVKHRGIIADEVANHPAQSFEEGAQVYVWGEVYHLHIVFSNKLDMVMDSKNKILTMKLTKRTSLSGMRQMLDVFYHNQLVDMIDSRYIYWEKVVKLEASSYVVKKMKSQWGNCRPSTGRICLNSQLAKRPVACFDYVMVHELTHLWYRGHGPRFWAKVEEFYPNWYAVKEYLNKTYYP